MLGMMRRPRRMLLMVVMRMVMVVVLVMVSTVQRWFTNVHCHTGSTGRSTARCATATPLTVVAEWIIKQRVLVGLRRWHRLKVLLLLRRCLMLLLPNRLYLCADGGCGTHRW